MRLHLSPAQNAATLLDVCEETILAHLPAYLDWLIAWDVEEHPDPAERLYGVLPAPTADSRGRLGELPQLSDWTTPALTLEVEDHDYSRDDAGGMMHDLQTVVARVTIQQSDVGAVTARQFLASLSAYTEGVAWCLETQLCRHPRRCEFGIDECYAQGAGYSPEFGEEGSDVWYRSGAVRVIVSQRKYFRAELPPVPGSVP